MKDRRPLVDDIVALQNSENSSSEDITVHQAQRSPEGHGNYRRAECDEGAARDDETGVLVLSALAGAAQELKEAPHSEIGLSIETILIS